MTLYDPYEEFRSSNGSFDQRKISSCCWKLFEGYFVAKYGLLALLWCLSVRSRCYIFCLLLWCPLMVWEHFLVNIGMNVCEPVCISMSICPFKSVCVCVAPSASLSTIHIAFPIKDDAFSPPGQHSKCSFVSVSGGPWTEYLSGRACMAEWVIEKDP